MCLAVPGQIIEIRDESPLTRHGLVDFGGAVKDISLVFVPDARVGDHVLVHVGFAVSCIDAGEAARMLEYLGDMGAEGGAEEGEE